jgi:hypothetical protein
MKMNRKELRESVDDRWKDIIESLLYQSTEGLDGYLSDMKYLSKVKTFKHICKCNGEDYREVIKQIKEKD